MSYFVGKIVFPLKFEKNLGVDLGSELVPVDLVTEWTVNDVASAILVGESCTIGPSCTRQIRVLEICISL